MFPQGIATTIFASVRVSGVTNNYLNQSCVPAAARLRIRPPEATRWLARGCQDDNPTERELDGSLEKRSRNKLLSRSLTSAMQQQKATLSLPSLVHHIRLRLPSAQHAAIDQVLRDSGSGSSLATVCGTSPTFLPFSCQPVSHERDAAALRDHECCSRCARRFSSNFAT